MLIPIIIAVVVTLIVVMPVTYFVTVSKLKNDANSKIGNADVKAREIIDDALKTAETKKKEALLEVKEESIKTKKLRNAELNFSVMKSVYFQKKNLWIRDLRQLSRERLHLLQKRQR